MKSLMLATAILLTGCGTYGEPLWLARWYDSQDPCQIQNNGGRYPSFCGASSGRMTIYSAQGQPLGYIQPSK